MARPDLSTPEGLGAYRSELRGIARPWRYAGFAIVLVGTAAMIFVAYTAHDVLGTRHGQASVAAIAFGWILLIVAMARRTLYHRRRLAGAPPNSA